MLLWARLDSDDPKAKTQVNLALQLGQPLWLSAPDVLKNYEPAAAR